LHAKENLKKKKGLGTFEKERTTMGVQDARGKKKTQKVCVDVWTGRNVRGALQKKTMQGGP